tara:strand:- start:3255 stop:3554 length:300 start_codon:yes stop_codon:yes gene_type:complete
MQRGGQERGESQKKYAFHFASAFNSLVVLPLCLLRRPADNPKSMPKHQKHFLFFSCNYRNGKPYKYPVRPRLRHPLFRNNKWLSFSSLAGVKLKAYFNF